MMRRCCPPGHSPTSVMPSPWSMLGAAAILAAVAISALALAHGAGRASPEPGIAAADSGPGGAPGRSFSLSCRRRIFAERQARDGAGRDG